MHQFLPSAAYRDLPKAPQQWVIEKLVPTGGLVNVFGKPKTGKSFLALGWAQAIVNGEPEWEGYPIHAHGNVAYLQIDTPREEWSQRLSRLPLTPAKDRDLYIADMWQVPQFPVDILDPQQTSVKWLKDQLAVIQPVLTIIDTLREVHGGDENDSTVMRNVIAHLVSACRPSALVLLSHARKDSILTANGDDDMMDQGRGSSYVAGRMDVIVKLTPKRLTFKGRATGQVTAEIAQEPATGLVTITHDATNDTILAQLKRLEPQFAGAPETEWLKAVAAITGASYSTCYRRLQTYKQSR